MVEACTCWMRLMALLSWGPFSAVTSRPPCFLLSSVPSRHNHSASCSDSFLTYQAHWHKPALQSQLYSRNDCGMGNTGHEAAPLPVGGMGWADPTCHQGSQRGAGFVWAGVGVGTHIYTRAPTCTIPHMHTCGMCSELP